MSLLNQEAWWGHPCSALRAATVQWIWFYGSPSSPSMVRTSTYSSASPTTEAAITADMTRWKTNVRKKVSRDTNKHNVKKTSFTVTQSNTQTWQNTTSSLTTDLNLSGSYVWSIHVKSNVHLLLRCQWTGTDFPCTNMQKQQPLWPGSWIWSPPLLWLIALEKREAKPRSEVHFQCNAYIYIQPLFAGIRY